jgi:uncharacterized protein with HEPN domain
LTERERQAILQILERCQLIREFTSVGRDAFFSSRLSQEATIRCLEVIGEATRRFSDETKRTWPKVPWRDIAELRNALIHQYEAVSPSEVWNTATGIVPRLELWFGRIRLR